VLTPFVLSPTGDGYAETTHSGVLPGLRLAELASFLDRPTTSAAIRAYQGALRAKP
jgi:hypothetical protein